MAVTICHQAVVKSGETLFRECFVLPWSSQAAADRIRRHIQSAPESDISVENFGDFMRNRRLLLEASGLLGGKQEPIWSVSPNKAVTTHGVHVYANLQRFNDVLLEQGRETAASHERAMQFLHLYFSAADALIASFDIQRVDFHGSRLHAVVLTPEGEDREAERIEKALAFSSALIELVRRAGDRYGQEFRTDVRIGVDSGPAVAINSGRRGEPDPLFVGSPANEAAHLAEGDEAGVYVSLRAERTRKGGNPFAVTAMRLDEAAQSRVLRESFDFAGLNQSAQGRLEEAYARFSTAPDASLAGLRPATFTFHHHQPPLSTIVYADHPPSNSIRMALVSLFADIAGFTAYVDAAIATRTVAQAVRNLYVIRSELSDVLQKDFKGRKVRYIGDCLHGVIAEGDARETDERESVKTAVLAAGGIRSSFELCCDLLPGLGGLQGIGIGLELGPTPISRLGLGGEASVRCSASKATCVSEGVQRGCGPDDTAIGERAYAAGPARVQHLFGAARSVPGLDYAAAVAQLAGVASPAVHAAPRLEAHWKL